MAHILLYQWNPMVGCDPHFELGIVPPPVFVAPFPMTPHLVGMVLEGVDGEADLTTTVQGDGSQIVQIGSDIGSFIPHIPLPLDPPNLLFWLWTSLSTSTSPFGSFSVHADGKPVAAALEYLASPQINCSDFKLPAPLGQAFTWGTVVVDITLKDLALSFADYLYDVAIDWVLEKLVGKGLKKAFPKIDEEAEEFFKTNIVTLINKLTKTTPLKPVDDFKEHWKPSEAFERYFGE